MTAVLLPLAAILVLGVGVLFWYRREDRRKTHMRPVVAPLPMSWEPPTDLGPDFDRGLREANEPPDGSDAYHAERDMDLPQGLA